MSPPPLVQWQHFGPGMSGYIDKFWINNADPNAMYTDLDMGNGHVTLDHGLSWRSYHDCDGTGNTLNGVTGIEFSFQDPDFGLLMAKDGIYQSHDRGRTWQYLSDTDPTNTEKHNIMAVDPNNDNNWYIGAGQGWMIKYTHYTQSGIIETSNRNHSEGFILKSTDRGRTWTKISAPFPANSSFSRIIVDPRDSNVVYASCQHGVYRSTDAGYTWAKVPGAGLPYNQPRDMASFHDRDTGEFLLYIVEITHYTPKGDTIETTGGVYRSADGGNTWENLTGDLAIDMSRISLWGYRERYWRAIAFWLEISQTQAQQRYPVLPTATFSQFHQMAVDPTNKDRIYLVHNFKHDYSFPPGNIWMTENGGKNWFAAAREGPYWVNGVDQDYWQSRAVQPPGANTTMAHVHREHYEHDDTQTGPRFVLCNQLGEVYTAFAQQVMRSTDHGATWVQIDDDETYPGSGHWVGRGNSNLPGETFCLDTGTPGTYLWGSGEHGLWRNTDDGYLVRPGAIAVEQLTGQSIADDSPLSIAAIAVHPHDRNRIYTLQFRQTQRGRLCHSPDNGKTWEVISQPIAFPGANDVIDQRSLLIDPVDPGQIYFCVPLSEWEMWAKATSQWVFNGPSGFSGHGIYKSTDGGHTWARVDNGIPAGRSVYRMAMDPANPQTLYAALNETHELTPGGLYRTTDGGSTWNPVNLPAGVASVNDIVVHPPTGDLYIACGSYKDAGKTGGAFVSHDAGQSWTLLFDMPNVRHVSPSVVNPDVIAVNVGQAQSIGSLNPGAYVTVDGGVSWHKINRCHGQPDAIRLLRTDPYREDILWCSLHGTGFFRADISALFPPPPPPTITAAPVPTAVRSGDAAFFSVSAAGEDIAFQWRRDGVDIPEATGPMLYIENVDASDAGAYSVVVSNRGGSLESASVALTINLGGKARLKNLSSRARVGSGDEVLIPGFALTGSGAKRLLVRAAGPAVANIAPLPGLLPDPVMTLNEESVAVMTNDDWPLFADQAALAEAVDAAGAFTFAPSTKDAAMVVEVSARPYTVVTSGVDATTGVALIELYDLDPPESQVRLANLSTRAVVGRDDDILIPGFVIEGDRALTMLIRAVGPTLADVGGVQGVLEDPVLKVLRGGSEVAFNDDWQQAPNLGALEAATAESGAFPLSVGGRDAAVLVSLNPGDYTVHVSGKNTSTGVALMELYVVE